jgi:hypothetical protein
MFEPRLQCHVCCVSQLRPRTTTARVYQDYVWEDWPEAMVTLAGMVMAALSAASETVTGAMAGRFDG